MGQEIPPPWTRDYRRMDSWGKKEKKEKMNVNKIMTEGKGLTREKKRIIAEGG